MYDISHLRVKSPSPPFQRLISLAEWLHRLASPHSHVRVCIANTCVYMRPSSGRCSTCSVLSARSHVCVNCLVVTYSGHFLLRYSHGTFCNVLNALRRFRPLTSVCSYVSQPPRGYIFRTDRSSLLQHIPSHISVLSNTHFCSCFHCHYYDYSFSFYQKIMPWSGFRDW
jgi:hypothetical protein